MAIPGMGGGMDMGLPQGPQTPPTAAPQATSRLAAMIPQIMNAIGGGDERTQALLMKQDQQNQQRMKMNNIQNFMRAVTSSSTGEITEDSITHFANIFGVAPNDAMKVITDFENHRAARRGPDQTFSEELPSGRIHQFSIPGGAPAPPGAMRGTISGSPTPAPKEPGFASSPGGIFDKSTGKIVTPATPKETKGSPLATLLEERDDLPEGSPDLAAYNANITKITQAGGLQISDISIDDAAEGILKYGLKLSDFSKRGGFPSKIVSRMKIMEPEFNFSKHRANLKHQQNQGNLTTLAIVNGIDPMFDELLNMGKALNNSSLHIKNKAVNFIREQTGDPRVTAFNNMRDDLMEEAQKVLGGAGALSDAKYGRAIENFTTAQSYPQLQAAVKVLKKTLASRAHAIKSLPYDPHTGKAQSKDAVAVDDFLGGL